MERREAQPARWGYAKHAHGLQHSAAYHKRRVLAAAQPSAATLTGSSTCAWCRPVAHTVAICSCCISCCCGGSGWGAAACCSSGDNAAAASGALAGLRGGGGGGGGGCASFSGVSGASTSAPMPGSGGCSPSACGSASSLSLLPALSATAAAPLLRCSEEVGDICRSSGRCLSSRRLLDQALAAGGARGGGGGGGGDLGPVAAPSGAPASPPSAEQSSGSSTTEPPGCRVMARSLPLVGCITSSSSDTALSRRCRLAADTQACRVGSP
jgi:hypothetical protein